MTHFASVIKQKALSLGFCDCGITDCSAIAIEFIQAFEQRIANQQIADLNFLTKNKEKRYAPQLLVPEAKSIIVVLANYYQNIPYLDNGNYKIALYAWGNDYHQVIKNKLKILQQFILENIDKNSINRYFVDTAPTMDKYLAYRAGLGWIGKNTLLHGKEGSFCCIGLLFTSVILETDQPYHNNPCLHCDICIKACPTKALLKPYCLDAKQCWAYQTIENKERINITDKTNKQQYIYGCDICQKVCPHNRDLPQTTIKEFFPNKELTLINDGQIEHMTNETFNTLFAHTPIKRIGYEKMKDNISTITRWRNLKSNI